MISVNIDSPFDIRGDPPAQWMVPAWGPGGLQLFTRSEIPGMIQAAGSAVLVNGTITINNLLIGPNVGVFAFHQNVSGVPGALRCTARINGVSFTITSANPLDTSTIAWMLVSG